MFVIDSTRAVTLFAAGYCAWCTTANAQIGAHYYSLEAVVAGAESVVRGTIEETSHELLRCKFNVSVQEVLKGRHIEQVSLTIKAAFAGERFERFDQWRDAHTEFLIFLEPKFGGNATEDDENWLMIRLDRGVPAERGYKRHAPPIFSMDFRVLQDHDEIVTTAREAVAMFERSKRKPIDCITVPIPRRVGDKCRPSGDVNVFTVPVVEEMRTIAEKMMIAPEALDKDFGRPEYLPPVLRASGLKVMERLDAKASP